jgi:CHAT domain-containing protein
MMGEKVVVTGENPGLLSGLVLAGANLPPKGNGDDGILTASEVTELDLTGVELAILSACETGLGKTAGGEGIFGLQRAFQLAGARTVVASSWKVPDLSTKELMVRFYGNLWEKKMGKLEALREAQLWVMKEGKAAGLDRGIDDESVVVKDTKKEPIKQEGSTKGEMLPPKYWAAWILSGAWN